MTQQMNKTQTSSTSTEAIRHRLIAIEHMLESATKGKWVGGKYDSRFFSNDQQASSCRLCARHLELVQVVREETRIIHIHFDPSDENISSMDTKDTVIAINNEDGCNEDECNCSLSLSNEDHTFIIMAKNDMPWLIRTMHDLLDELERLEKA